MSDKQLKQQIAALQRRLSKMPRANAPAPAPSRQPAPPRRNGRKTKSAGTPSNLSNLGLLSFGRSELFMTITCAADGSFKKSAPLHPSSLSVLKSLSQTFEQIAWDLVKFEFRPGVGTTVGGMLAFGFEWGPTTRDTKNAVLGLSPSASVAVHKSAAFSIPANRLRGRLWYTIDAGGLEDKQPGQLCVAMDANSDTRSKTVGEIWLHYKIRAQGTKPSA